MERQAIVLISSIVGFLLLAGVLAYWFGAPPQEAAKTHEPVKKFRAKPGTQRENARAIVSDIPSADRASPAGTSQPGGADGEPVEVWGRLTPGQGAEPYESVSIPLPAMKASTVETLRAALQAGDPATGVRDLRTAMENTTDPDALAALHFAEAQLQNRMGEGHAAARDAAFQSAIDAALAEDLKVAAVTQYANTYLLVGDDEKALDIAVKIDLQDAEFTPEIAQLGVLTAIAMDRRRMPEAATEHFLWVLERIQEQGKSQKARYERIYRQAGLLLHRLYLATERDREAKRLKLRMELWLEE